MRWKRGLIRLSIVLTVLWAFASLYISLEQFTEEMKPYWGTDNWKEWHRTLMQIHLTFAFVYWIVGAALWWVFLYIGFWIARGFRGSE